MFFNRTVSGVVADIARKVDLLYKIKQRELDREAARREEAGVLLDEAAEARAEAAAAHRVAEKLSALIS